MDENALSSFLDDTDDLCEEFNRIQNSAQIKSTDRVKNFTRWIKSIRNPPTLNIPEPDVISEEDYRLSQLTKNDPRGIFAGKIVGCCQHPQGWAEPCAWHGHESPNGAFWAVERHGNIKAVAWVWRHADALVLDSVEVKGKHSVSLMHGMYVRAAQSVVGKLGIQRVYAGCGRLNTWLPPDESDILYRPFPTPAPYKFQTNEGKEYPGDDSREVHLIANN